MVEKGVDMMIGVDILKNAYEDLCDTAILVSGDGDFYPALQAAKDQGKHVEIAAFDTNISPETARIADLHIKLNKTYFSNLWMTKTDQKNAAKSYYKEEVSDEFSSPEGENKKPKRKPSSRPVSNSRQYKSNYKTRTRSTKNNSSRREVSPSTEPPALNGTKSGQRKGWLKKIFS